VSVRAEVGLPCGAIAASVGSRIAAGQAVLSLIGQGEESGGDRCDLLDFVLVLLLFVGVNLLEEMNHDCNHKEMNKRGGGNGGVAQGGRAVTDRRTRLRLTVTANDSGALFEHRRMTATQDKVKT
jgi:hypothetical protein